MLNLANRELFAKIFLANVHRYNENVFGICTDFSLFAKFFLANSFTHMVCQNFPPLVLLVILSGANLDFLGGAKPGLKQGVWEV